MKKNEIKKNINEIKRISAKMPKSINEALNFNDLAEDDDMEMEEEPMDEPMEQPSKPVNAAGINIDNFITTMRKQSLDIMSQLADHPEDETYEFAKKIWQLAEKAYNDKRDANGEGKNPQQHPQL
jgi:hypothetical protein